MHLEIKELLKLDSTEGLLVFCQILRKMHGTNGLTTGHEFVFVQQGLGKIFLYQEVQSLIKGCLDDLDQTGLTDSPEPIDRQVGDHLLPEPEPSSQSD